MIELRILASVSAPVLLVDGRFLVGDPCLGFSLVLHASKYSGKNDLGSCSYYSSS